jgi:hypothetical protein
VLRVPSERDEPPNNRGAEQDQADQLGHGPEGSQSAGENNWPGVQVVMRDDENPPDTSAIPRASTSIPPEGKVTLQLALTGGLVFIAILAVAREFAHVQLDPATTNLLCVAAGGLLGLLTGGSNKGQR